MAVEEDGRGGEGREKDRTGRREGGEGRRGEGVEDGRRKEDTGEGRGGVQKDERGNITR